jgi:signal transduction histidine kinase
VVQSTAILREQSGITLKYQRQGSIYAWADEFRVEEVLTNYMSNAIHYAAGPKEIRVTTQYRKGLVRVGIFNTGNQIPPEEQERIWTKFYKVDKARTREYGGSGIGLSIVKAIMESFHQQCGVENHPDGVEFWFELESDVEKNPEN